MNKGSDATNTVLCGRVMPERIFLMDYDDNNEIVWCEDPDPSGRYGENQVVEYVRVDRALTKVEDTE